MVALVVDEDLYTSLELFDARYDLRFIEVVGHTPHLCGGVCNCLVQQLEDGAARFESHPVVSFLCFRMSRLERETVIGIRRQKFRDWPCGFVPLDERLRRDEAAGVTHVELARIRFTS